MDGRADPLLTLGRGGERSPQHFYATSYSSANATARPSFQPQPFVLPATRPTGYSANFRPVVGFHSNMDKMDNPAMQDEFKAGAVYLTRTQGDFRGIPPSPPKRGVATAPAPFTGFVGDVPQTLPRSRAVLPPPPSEAHANFPAHAFTSSAAGLSRHAPGPDRSSAHVSNEMPPSPTVRDALPQSEQRASYSSVVSRTDSLPPVARPFNGFTRDIRRAPYLADSSQRVVGLAPAEPAPAALPSSTHRAFPHPASRSSPVQAGTQRIEPLGFAQNTLPYVIPPEGDYYRTRMPSPPRPVTTCEGVHAPSANNFARSTRTHAFSHGPEVDKLLSVQQPSVRLRQQHTYLFAHTD